MNRSEKIAYLAEIFVGAGITSGMAPVMAKDVLDRIFPPLAPIERDESYDRTYIPMLGNSEVQTKGKGSTFRIFFNEDRMPISVSSIEQAFLTELALYIRQEYGE